MTGKRSALFVSVCVLPFFLTEGKVARAAAADDGAQRLPPSLRGRPDSRHPPLLCRDIPVG
nr:hypothetical protein [Acetobacter persici]